MYRSGRTESLRVLELCVRPENEGWVAWHTLSNGFYIVARETKSQSEAKRFISELLEWVQVAHVTTADAIKAEQLDFPDFEDALQVAAAEACISDFIITRNITDFIHSSIVVFTPEDFLEKHG